MARQTFTDAERTNLRQNDPGAFRLPLDASLNLENFAAYAATDTAIAQSLVNIRHLNNTRQFRGRWIQNPVDGTLPVPYTRGQVVIGSDNHLYMLTTDSSVTIPATIPDPVSDAGASVWVTLSAGLDQPITELTSNPESIALNLFHGSGQTATFTINPSADSDLLQPEVTVTSSSGVVGTPSATSINSDNQTTVTVAARQTNADARVIVTTAARSQSGPNDARITHEGGQVDSLITFRDARVLPTVSGEGTTPRASRLNSMQNISYDIDLSPDGSTVAAGTAYDVSWQARVGTATPGTGTTDGTYNVPNITANSDVVFTFPLVSSPSNGQTAIPNVGMDSFRITRSIESYIPWYWIFSANAPTSLANATEAILVGDTQSNAFPTGNISQIDISGNVGATTHLWFLVPATINRAISLGTGIATVQSQRLASSTNFNVNDIAGTAITYSVHGFRLGLVQSPTRFSIFSA